MKKLFKIFCFTVVLLTLFTSAGCGILKEPPPLIVTYKDQSITASRGTTSWHYDKPGNDLAGFQSDAFHPLQTDRESKPYIILSDDVEGTAYIKLDYSTAPKSFVVKRWSFEVWESYNYGDDLPEAEIIELVDGKLPVESGYLYSISAQWKHEKYSGTVYNDSFYVISASEVQ